MKWAFVLLLLIAGCAAPGGDLAVDGTHFGYTEPGTLTVLAVGAPWDDIKFSAETEVRATFEGQRATLDQTPVAITTGRMYTGETIFLCAVGGGSVMVTVAHDGSSATLAMNLGACA